MRVLILGVNGFIGNALTERILTTTDWEIYGLDVGSDKIQPFLSQKRFRYLEGDIAINKEWIEYHIKKADVVLPLVAIATPAAYVERPLEVFQLDFEENLRVVKQCVQYKKRLIFPSTSEVYGMCSDPEFDEEVSNLVYGPIHKQRWIYSCSKQLLDRVIYAFGQANGLRFTLFRPFNWIGPNLDNIDSPKEGSSRVLTQFLHNIVYGEPIKLVDGGNQRRCFTYISDGIDALMKILINENKAADGQIFNVGNPDNDYSIKELAEKLKTAVGRYPGCEAMAEKTKIMPVHSDAYYGLGYQDIMTRKPSIRLAKQRLGWQPRVSMDEAITRTLDFYLKDKKPAVLSQIP